MPNTRLQAFKQTGATVTINANTTSANTAIVPGSGEKARVVNAGTTAVFVKFGTSAPTATAADIAVGAGESVELYIGRAVFVAVVAASGTPTVYITPGT